MTKGKQVIQSKGKQVIQSEGRRDVETTAIAHKYSKSIQKHLATDAKSEYKVLFLTGRMTLFYIQ